jgi:hypothetical protein
MLCVRTEIRNPKFAIQRSWDSGFATRILLVTSSSPCGEWRVDSFLCRHRHSQGLNTCPRDMVKPHDLLVQVSSVPYSTSTPCLSTSWSTRGL